MEKELFNLALGAKGQFKLSAKDMNLSAEINYDLGGVKAKAEILIEDEAGVDVAVGALKKLIPGQVDDLVLDGLNGLLKKFLAA